jgi:hypothetical protein
VFLPVVALSEVPPKGGELGQTGSSREFPVAQRIAVVLYLVVTYESSSGVARRHWSTS